MKYNYDSLKFLNHGEDVNTKVAFERKELALIMRIYGRMVSLGEWRDYSISMLKSYSVFSIYVHTSQHPIYMIKKTAKKLNKPESFSIILMDGKILKIGYDLAIVLKALEAKLIRLVK